MVSTSPVTRSKAVQAVSAKQLSLRPRYSTNKGITAGTRIHSGPPSSSKRFTPLNVQLDETAAIKTLRRSGRSRSPPTSPKFKISKIRRSKRAKSLSTSPVPENASPKEAAMAAIEEQFKTFLPQVKPSDLTGGVDFFPRIAWGEKEVVGKSKIERADRNLEIWQEVKRAHVKALPSAVPFIDGEIAKAKATRAALEDCEENHRVGVENPFEVAVKEQIETLKWALAKSKFEPERENIRGAIEGYKSGEIGYNKHFTILYAGKVVDTAPDYFSFVRDRQERLDRYFKTHGPHWIFYEAPLDVHPETKPKLMHHAALKREHDWTNLGPYHVQQGFWKRHGWVSRMPTLQKATTALNEEQFHKIWTEKLGWIRWCQDEGPKQAFRTLLDSGATYPSLFKEDLQKLAVDEHLYACQAVMNMSTANGKIHSRVYELYVAVLDNDNKHLVDPQDPVWPFMPAYLGGLCPVVESAEAIQYDQNGVETNMRLSGLLPFLACYVASAPMVDTLFLGEDRNDVLGSYRIPGARRWHIDLNSEGKQKDELDDMFKRWGNPRMAFLHSRLDHTGQQQTLTDVDDGNMHHASTVTGPGGSTRVCPSEDHYARLQKEEREKAELEAKQKAFQEHMNNPVWASGRAEFMQPPL